MRTPTWRLPLLVLAVLGLTLGACAADPAADAPAATVEEASSSPEATAGSDVDTNARFKFGNDSAIAFVGSKVTGSHEGGFHKFDGQISVTGSDPTTGSVEIEIQTGSLWSDNDNLTEHLKSPDFFDVATYPNANFASSSIAASDDGTFTVTGNLTLHGVTKQISFPATITPQQGGGFTTIAEFSIKRFDFDIVYPGPTDDLIRDDVLIKLNLTTGPALA